MIIDKSKYELDKLKEEVKTSKKSKSKKIGKILKKPRGHLIDKLNPTRAIMKGTGNMKLVKEPEYTFENEIKEDRNWLFK